MAKISRTSKRYGPRYGRTVKYKVDKIESLAKADYKCPFCLATKVKRLYAGIWKCSKCEKTFTSKAYFVDKVRKNE